MEFDLDLDESENKASELAEETFALSKIEQVQIDFKRYESTLAEMAAKAGTHIITDAKTNAEAVVLAGQAKALFKAIEKKRKEIISGPSEFVSAVNQLVKPLTTILTGIDTGLKARITRFDQEQTAKRLEAQRKANEEAQRIQDEINTAAAKVGESPAVVVAPVVLDIPKVTRTASGSATQTTTWTHEVIDFAILPDEYKLVDSVGLNKAVKGGIRVIPGVRIYEVQNTRIRAAALPQWDDNEKF